MDMHEENLSEGDNEAGSAGDRQRCCWCCYPAGYDRLPESDVETDERGEEVHDDNSSDQSVYARTVQPNGEEECLLFMDTGVVCQGTESNKTSFNHYLKKVAAECDVPIEESFEQAKQSTTDLIELFKNDREKQEIQAKIQKIVQEYINKESFPDTERRDTASLPFIPIDQGPSVLEERVKWLANTSYLYFGALYESTLRDSQDQVRNVLRDIGLLVDRVFSGCLHVLLFITNDEQLAKLIALVPETIVTLSSMLMDTANQRALVKEQLPEVNLILNTVISAVSNKFQLMIRLNQKEMLDLPGGKLGLTIAAFPKHQPTLATVNTENLKRCISPLEELRPKTYKALLAQQEQGMLGPKLVPVEVTQPGRKFLPRTLTLVESVPINGPGRCYSVHYYKGLTYVGCEGGIVYVIDETFRLHEFLSVHVKNVHAIRGYEGALYILCYMKAKEGLKVYVVDLSGIVRDEWEIMPKVDVGVTYQFTIVSGQLVIPDRSKKQLAVYSLDDRQIIKFIDCSMIYRHTAMCSLGSDSVIIADEGSSKEGSLSKVRRVNLSTPKTEWTCPGVINPQSVTSYGDSYVCVAGTNADSRSVIYVLDASTGHILNNEMIDENMTGYVYDLDTKENTLIVLDFGSKAVLFYQMGE